MDLIIIFVLIAILFFWHQSSKRERNRHKSEIETLHEALESVNSELNELRDKIEYMSLPAHEKEELSFENAPDLPLPFFEKLEKDQILTLVSGSYYYPSDDIYITRFQYKHDYIDRENKTEHGYEIHGFQKLFNNDEWAPCTFLSNENETSTLDCAGTIKKA